MKLDGDDLEYFLKCCQESGIKVTPGTGKVTLKGEPFNVKEVLDASYPGKTEEYNLYQSLKRGLEEAIDYENGEVELRTVRIKDGVMVPFCCVGCKHAFSNECQKKNWCFVYRVIHFFAPKYWVPNRYFDLSRYYRYYRWRYHRNR